MIRPLRQQHRRMFSVLGILLPVIFALGIASRNAVPPMSRLPGELQAAPQSSAHIIWERNGLFTDVPVQVQFLEVDRRLVISCSATEDFVKPDLLVYWSSGPVKVADELPGNAVLLGAFSDITLLLPDEATSNEGVLVLYSLADNEVIAASQQIRFDLLTK